MDPKTSPPLLAHILFMDIVGCSKLPSDEQKRIVGRLQELVRQSAEFQRSRESDQLISLPTGDGMALAFFNKLDAAAQCAIEVSEAIQAESLCKIRMGVHTGPVFVMEDINGKRNISGAGINRAERVMSCGDEGHILLSENVAESLRHLSAWRDKIHEAGECRAKDGWIRVWTLVDGPVGNTALPKKSKRHLRRRQLAMAASCVALALVVVAALAGAFRMGRSGSAFSSTHDRASIAVLPFDDLSPEKNQEYFSEGLAEELMSGLSKTPGLRVAGRISSFRFKNKTDDSRAIGGTLNVATILEGSVRKQGNRCKIAVQLIEASNGFQLWSETFDREMNDIFAVEEEIARTVTRALKVPLLGEKAAAKTTNAEAHSAYLEGRYFLARTTKANLTEAVKYFQQAIKLDPTYAPAWEGLGESRLNQAGAAYVPPEEGFQQARDAVERALELDPDFGDAHATLGSIQMVHDWDWAGADSSLEAALSADPHNANVLRRACGLEKDLGRFDMALSLCRQAINIDPLSPLAHYSLAFAAYYGGQEKEAAVAIHKAMELAPDMVNTQSLLGLLYLAQSQPQEALAEAEKEKHPAFRLQALALAYQALGRTKESDVNLNELIAKFREDAPYQIAEVYAFRDEKERAFEWMERAYAERDGGLSEMKGDPLLKSLERDPRYPALLKKMHLPL